jgi:hypothetical protein
MENLSEVARIRQQIQDEYEAAQSGLAGFATGIARHDFLAKRMDTLGGLHEELIDLVGEEEAIAIIANSIWTPDQQGTVPHQNVGKPHP